MEIMEMNSIYNEEFRIVVLKCPYANWADRDVPLLFNDVVTLKLSGYQTKHFFGVMPIDGTDFLTDHLLVCQQDKITKKYVPVLGVKSFPYDYAQPFFTDFTIEAFLKKGNHGRHLESLMGILENCKKSQNRIAYYSSWTVAPSVRDNRGLMSVLKEIFAAITYHHHVEENISELLGLGVPKFKTDLFFQKWGFERVRYKDEDLENIPFRILGGIDGVFIHLKKYTDFVISCAEKYSSMWENRFVLGQSPKFPAEGVFENKNLLNAP